MNNEHKRCLVGDFSSSASHRALAEGGGLDVAYKLTEQHANNIYDTSTSVLVVSSSSSGSSALPPCPSLNPQPHAHAHAPAHVHAPHHPSAASGGSPLITSAQVGSIDLSATALSRPPSGPGRKRPRGEGGESAAAAERLVWLDPWAGDEADLDRARDALYDFDALEQQLHETVSLSVRAALALPDAGERLRAPPSRMHAAPAPAPASARGPARAQAAPQWERAGASADTRIDAGVAYPATFLVADSAADGDPAPWAALGHAYPAYPTSFSQHPPGPPPLELGPTHHHHHGHHGHHGQRYGLPQQPYAAPGGYGHHGHGQGLEHDYSYAPASAPPPGPAPPGRTRPPSLRAPRPPAAEGSVAELAPPSLAYAAYHQEHHHQHHQQQQQQHAHAHNLRPAARGCSPPLPPAAADDDDGHDAAAWAPRDGPVIKRRSKLPLDAVLVRPLPTYTHSHTTSSPHILTPHPHSLPQGLRAWLRGALCSPYPNAQQKAELAARLRLTQSQVHNWLSNVRKRCLAPWLKSVGVALVPFKPLSAADAALVLHVAARVPEEEYLGPL